MSITGHKTAQEVGRYTRSAEQMKLAEQAMGLLKVSNPKNSVRHFASQVYEKSTQFEDHGRPGGTLAYPNNVPIRSIAASIFSCEFA